MTAIFLDPESPPTATEPVVVLDRLTKRYGAQTAVDELSFELQPATITGFVGPNGSGKTTTFRILLGLVRPDSGRVTIGDRSRVGAIIDNPAFHPALSARKNLRLLAALGGINPTRVDDVLGQVDLLGRSDDAVRNYSLGMQQRLGIAAALLPDPAVLLLDEPTNGLDPQGILEIREMLRRLASNGASILVSSHLLSEIEHICDRLVVIRSGSLVFSGPLTTLERQQQTAIAARPDQPEHLSRLATLLRQHGYEATIDGADVLIVSRSGDAGHVNRLAFDAGITLTELRTKREDLETTFLRMTTGGNP